jgi:capsular exopolysaccharide synthesis family protein
LTDVLAGSAPLKEAIVHNDDLGIDVLTAGQHSTNPLELIASNKFKELLKKLGEHYDQVILDTPPTQAVSDALVMGSAADAVVYVVKAHSTSINTVKHGLNRLKYANANVVGVVLNQVDTKKQSYYGGNDYYAGYFDSYGYSKT